MRGLQFASAPPGRGRRHGEGSLLGWVSVRSQEVCCYGTLDPFPPFAPLLFIFSSSQFPSCARLLARRRLPQKT